MGAANTPASTRSIRRASQRVILYHCALSWDSGEERMAATVDRIPYPRLRDFVALALQRVGLPREDAATVAALMAEADLQGSDGHGVIRLAPYVKPIRAGGFNTRASIRVIAERPAMALLHGDNGMGHLVMKRVAEMAIDKARMTGVAWVGAQWSNHAGPASLYA